MDSRLVLIQRDESKVCPAAAEVIGDFLGVEIMNEGSLSATEFIEAKLDEEAMTCEDVPAILRALRSPDACPSGQLVLRFLPVALEKRRKNLESS